MICTKIKLVNRLRQNVVKFHINKKKVGSAEEILYTILPTMDFYVIKLNILERGQVGCYMQLFDTLYICIKLNIRDLIIYKIKKLNIC